MRILLLSFRDIKHPKKGGAEAVTYRHAEAMAEKGHEVIWLTSKFDGCKEKETIENDIRIIRKHSMVTIQFFAWYYYFKMFRNNIDIVIDQMNTIPFFTPIFVKEKKIFFVHHFGDLKMWTLEKPFPLNIIVWFSEQIFLRLYRNICTICVSESTKRDLQRIGFKKINVIADGCDVEPLQNVELTKKNYDSLVFVSRLVPMKQVEDALRVVCLVKKTNPNVKLWIIGTGPENYTRKLEKLVTMLEITENVQFLGYLTYDKRNEYLKRAGLLLVTSIKEGWGLNVIEAGACGTPTVAYNVPGLRDSVKNGVTGVLCAPNPDKMACAIVDLWIDKKVLMTYSKNALDNSRQFNWDKSAKDLTNILDKIIFE